MALTGFQRQVCRVVAESRIASGESYVAGGAALGELTGSPRVSRDVDLFHDTDEALAATWASDKRLLEATGFTVKVLRDRSTLVEAEVGRGDESVLLQWVRDSAYRFFPLVQHEDFGLVLHPFDLATNKVLALVGRLEPRDWVDVVLCHERVQPLGYLAWAACGKDPGFSPASILEHAGRSTRYRDEDLRGLQFEGPTPDAAGLSRRWHAALDQARSLVSVLPADEAGKAVLDDSGAPCRASLPDLMALLVQGRPPCFHAGSIRGALPRIVR